MRNQKKIAALATGALVLGSAGVAYAYWTTTGSGSGSGSTTAGVVDSLTFTQNPAGDADESVELDAMFPGDDPQDLTVRVRNTSGESAYVEFVKAYITTDKSGCTGADFLIDGEAAPSVAADAVDLAWTATDLVAGAAADATGNVQFNNLTATDQDACKGAVVTIHYLAS